MDYQPIADYAQLQLLEGLLRVVLHGIVLVMAGASVLLLGLCVSAVRLPRWRPSADEGRERGRSGGPLSAARRGGPVHTLAATRHWYMDADL
ncbi:MAG: hypothetical protein ACR2HB_05660 [Dehalococcoidia bacterium]